MVYLDVDDLGYGPFVESWLLKAYSADEDRALIRDLFEKWVVRLLDFKRREVGFFRGCPVALWLCVATLSNS